MVFSRLAVLREKGKNSGLILGVFNVFFFFFTSILFYSHSSRYSKPLRRLRPISYLFCLSTKGRKGAICFLLPCTSAVYSINNTSFPQRVVAAIITFLRYVCRSHTRYQLLFVITLLESQSRKEMTCSSSQSSK